MQSPDPQQDNHQHGGAKPPTVLGAISLTSKDLLGHNNPNNHDIYVRNISTSMFMN